MDKSTADRQEKSVRLFDRSSPYYLLNLFSLLSVLAVVVIMLMAGYGVYRIYSNELVKDAERDAIAVGQAIFEQEQIALSSRDSDGRKRMAVAQEDFAGLDGRIRRYLRPFHIYQINVSSRDKIIVYSTDPFLLGRIESSNTKLDRVLQSGEATSDLQKKDEVTNLGGEHHYDVDIVETYLPIKSDGVIIGSFELHVDVTRMRGRVVKVLALSAAVLFSVLVAVFTSFYLPMRKGASQLKQAQDELRKLASTDMLTGLFNRRHLMARVHEEYSRIHRVLGKQEIKSEKAIGFIMADLDHFKQINDGYGHLVGDEVLRVVSEKLRDKMRDYDVVGRYGGEEFLIVLPDCGLEGVKHAAERIRHDIERTAIVAGARSLNVTVSLGVACSEPGETNETAAIARADKALYKAKSEGRNRVAWL